MTSLDLRTVDDSGGVRALAAGARHDLQRADHLAHHSPWLSMLSEVPVVGRQVDEVRALTSAGVRIGDLVAGTADRVQTALDNGSTAGPPGRVPMVDAVIAAAGDLRTQLRTISVPSRSWLLPPLTHARQELVRKLADADRQLGEGDQRLRAARSLLAGPRRLLILGGNNAEMRAAGIATTAGVGTIDNGSIEVGDFVPTPVVNLPYPGVPIPDDWHALYEWLGPGQGYESTLMSPDFPTVAQVSLDISQHNVVGNVDGVVYVDAVALQSLLQLIGPVTVDGEEYDGTNATRKLLNENYLRFPNESDSPERREAQSKVAKAVFDALEHRSFPFTKLAAQLQDLGLSRHVMAWSSHPDEQELFHAVGADGSLEPHDLLIASQNLNASKLDYYVTMSVAGTVQDAGDHRNVDLAVTLTNPKHYTGAFYIEGGGFYANPGEYATFLVTYLPKEAYDVGSPDPGIGRHGPDGPLNAYSTVFRVPEGTSRTFHIEFSLPNHVSTVRIMPSGRLAFVPYTFDGYETNDSFPNPLDLASVARPEHVADWWLVFGLLLFGIGAAVAGDARGRLTVAGGRNARVDFEIGWWITIVGLAMIAIQFALFASTASF